ncbi:MAG: cation:H+ antiporter [Thermodesulfobacteriota bacterium]|nr:cation:H+ antiporter [Thermodesulfobacteriota bacterium]
MLVGFVCLLGIALSFSIYGIFGLYVGAEGLVRGSASLASQLGLRGLVIGLTVVAFGTSTPELMVGVKATHDGFFAISLWERGGGGLQYLQHCPHPGSLGPHKAPSHRCPGGSLADSHHDPRLSHPDARPPEWRNKSS